MKTYYAVIEIYKLYLDDPAHSFIWRKPCQGPEEAVAFIKRVGVGKKGLYRVCYAHICVE